MQLRSRTLPEAIPSPRRRASSQALKKNGQPISFRRKQRRYRSAPDAEKQRRTRTSRQHESRIMRMPIAKKREPLQATIERVPSERVKLRDRLEREMRNVLEGRGSRTRGWSGRSPRVGNDRAQLYLQCGPEAFLLPNDAQPWKSKFPIVRRLRNVKQDEGEACAVDCAGVQSAIDHSTQYRYKYVTRLAKRVQTAKCGA